MKKRLIPITLLLTVPIVLVLIFDPASTLSLRNFLEDIFGTSFSAAERQRARITNKNTLIPKGITACHIPTHKNKIPIITAKQR